MSTGALKRIGIKIADGKRGRAREGKEEPSDAVKARGSQGPTDLAEQPKHEGDAESGEMDSQIDELLNELESSDSE